jgi:hypothetical protein
MRGGGVFIDVTDQSRPVRDIMKRGLIATGVATVLAAAGLGLGLAASAGAATGQPAVTRYVLLNCLDKGQVRPGSYVLACADDGTGFQDLHWTSWTPRLASGYGTEYQNDCTPSCAEGHEHYYPVLVVAWGTGSVPGHLAERRYTQLTLIYPAARPPVYTLVKGKLVATYPVTQTVGAL